MVQRRRSVIALHVMVFAAVACASNRPQQDLLADSALVVLSGAINVKAGNDLDGSVEYLIDDPYPGSVVIGAISDRMSAAGWSQTEEWILPPLEKVESKSREWSRYTQGQTEVFAWTGAWTNKKGDIVTYFLTYDVTPPGTRAARLQVKGVKATSETVKRLRSMVKKPDGS